MLCPGCFFVGLGKFGPALCAMLAAGLSEAICLRPSWKFKEEGRRKKEGPCGSVDLASLYRELPSYNDNYN